MRIVSNAPIDLLSWGRWGGKTCTWNFFSHHCFETSPRRNRIDFVTGELAAMELYKADSKSAAWGRRRKLLTQMNWSFCFTKMSHGRPAGAPLLTCLRTAPSVLEKIPWTARGIYEYVTSKDEIRVPHAMSLSAASSSELQSGFSTTTGRGLKASNTFATIAACSNLGVTMNKTWDSSEVTFAAAAFSGTKSLNSIPVRLSGACPPTDCLSRARFNKDVSERNTSFLMGAVFFWLMKEEARRSRVRETRVAGESSSTGISTLSLTCFCSFLCFTVEGPCLFSAFSRRADTDAPACSTASSLLLGGSSSSPPSFLNALQSLNLLEPPLFVEETAGGDRQPWNWASSRLQTDDPLCNFWCHNKAPLEELQTTTRRKLLRCHEALSIFEQQILVVPRGGCFWCHTQQDATRKDNGLAILVSDTGELAGSKLKLPTDIAIVSKSFVGFRKNTTHGHLQPKVKLDRWWELGVHP